MKLKKVIGMLILSIALIITALIGVNSNAAESSYVLGITNVREARKWKTRCSIWNWWIKIR